MKKTLTALSLTAVCFIAFNLSANAEDFAKEKLFNLNKGEKNFHQKSKKFHEEKRIELQNRLNLTETQKEQAKTLREAAILEIKPLMEKIRAEYKIMKELQQAKASKEELQAQRDKMQTLRTEARSIREKHFAKFENILNSDQQKEFKTFKAEIKEKRAPNKKNGKKGKKGNKKGMGQKFQK